MQSVASSTVTREEALTLMKNMMRISVSSICFLRHLFPENLFKAKSYGSVQIRQLQAAEKLDDGTVKIEDEEAFLITQWLEKGVFKALESGYVSSMTFAIYTKQKSTGKDILLETYEFKITYPDGSNVAQFNDIKLFSKDSVKQQATQFIRSMIEFGSTLDPLPEERWVTLQLKYTNETPIDYEPEYFEATKLSLLSGVSMPLKINIGEVKTRDMNMKLKFAGLESLLFENDFAPAVSDIKSASKGTVLQAQKHVIEEETIREEIPPSSPTEMVNPRSKDLESSIHEMRLQQSPPSAQAPMDDSIVSNAEAYVRVKDHLLQSKIPVMKSCVKELNLDKEQVKTAFEELEKDGFLKRRGTSYSLARILPHETKLAESTKSPAINKKKRLQDEETNFDENEGPNRRTDFKAPVTTPNKSKWSNVLNKVDAISSKARSESAVTSQNEVPLSQRSDADAVLFNKLSKIKEPVHLSKKARY